MTPAASTATLERQWERLTEVSGKIGNFCTMAFERFPFDIGTAWTGVGYMVGVTMKRYNRFGLGAELSVHEVLSANMQLRDAQ